MNVRKLADRLRTADATQAKRILTAASSGVMKAHLEQAFRLFSGASRGEPHEWPAQLIARLRNQKGPAMRLLLHAVAQSRESCWLRPVRSPLIAAGGPIEEIVDAGFGAGDRTRAFISSSDFKTLTSFAGSTFRIFDLPSGLEVRRLDLPIRWGRAAISDPPRLAVVMAAQRTLLFVDLIAEAAEAIFHGFVMETIAISADGAWAVLASVPPDWDYETHEWGGPRTLRLFDLRNKLCVRTWEAHQAVIEDLALSGDGRFLATASRDQTARLFDLRNGRETGCWRSVPGIHSIAIQHNGRRIAYVSGGILTVRDRPGRIVGRFRNCYAAVGCIAFSRDGRKVVLAADSGSILAVDIQSRKRFGPFTGTQPYLTALTIDQTARRAITGEMGKQLVRWNLTGAHKEKDTSCWISGIWASKDQAIVAGDGLWRWDLVKGTRSAVRAPGGCKVASAPAAGLWVTAAWSEAAGGRMGSGKWGRGPTKWVHRSKHLFHSIQISRNGTRLVAIVHRVGGVVLEMKGGKKIWQRKALEIGVRPYLSPLGRYLLLCSLQGPLEIVDLETGESTNRTLPQPNIGPVLFTAADDCLVVQQGFDTALFNWKTNELRPLAEGRPSSISDNALWLVTERNGRTLVLWSLPEARRMATFTLDAPILHTALSSDGQFLVAGDQNGGVHILEKRSGAD